MLETEQIRNNSLLTDMKVLVGVVSNILVTISLTVLLSIHNVTICDGGYLFFAVVCGFAFAMFCIFNVSSNSNLNHTSICHSRLTKIMRGSIQFYWVHLRNPTVVPTPSSHTRIEVAILEARIYEAGPDFL